MADEATVDAVAVKTRKAKLQEALNLVEEAAVETKDELKELIGTKYQNLKEAVVETEGKLARQVAAAKAKATETAVHLKEVGGEKAKDMAKAVDTSVHENPWPYIGGAAVGALLLGYILGKKS